MALKKVDESVALLVLMLMVLQMVVKKVDIIFVTMACTMAVLMACTMAV